MLNRIRTLCKKSNISIMRLEDETGIARGSISRWDKSIPSVDKVIRVADYFGVSLDWLVNGKEVILSPGNAELLKQWSALDDEGKSTILMLIHSESKRKKVIEELSHTIYELNVQLTQRELYNRPILRSIQPASAGTGIEIGIADMEIVHVPDTPETERANFIIKVSGDSMLPIYQDGDQLLIERAEDVGVGEIGLFVVDGRGFVKQRGISELISLNKDYKNIPISANTVCNGRVIGVIKETDIK